MARGFRRRQSRCCSYATHMCSSSAFFSSRSCTTFRRPLTRVRAARRWNWRLRPLNQPPPASESRLRMLEIGVIGIGVAPALELGRAATRHPGLLARTLTPDSAADENLVGLVVDVPL